MEHHTKLIVVDASVLPDVIGKILEVKKLLANKEEKSSAAACKRIGISRSAYYKYKDCVFSYEDKLTQRIINLHAVLRDEAGVLSSVLSALYSLDANILTVNQNIPIDGVAGVTFSVRLNGEVQSPHELSKRLSEVQGVVDVKILSGE
jgi:chorismate mutase